MKYLGHTYGGFVPAISERGMTPTNRGSTRVHYLNKPRPGELRWLVIFDEISVTGTSGGLWPSGKSELHPR
jgi:hypothetical protein